MKVITLSEVASRLRQRRQGRGYLVKFINECTIEDAIPLDKVKDAIQEMDDLASHKVRPISFDQAVAIDMCIDIVKKLIESEG